MKFLNTQNIFIAIVVAILLAALYSYSFSKTHWYDGMASNDASGNATQNDTVTVNRVVPDSDSGYKLKPITDPSELLPKDVNSQWSTLNTNMNANSINNADLLPAGSHIGIDSIGSTLKNPSYDVRSQPIVPKVDVSPWNQSTIEPDIARIPFEIGQGAL